jgi:2-dehydro-3-deoxyphosphooctonate aldolase (KDO 8-P synthase)
MFTKPHNVSPLPKSSMCCKSPRFCHGKRICFMPQAKPGGLSISKKVEEAGNRRVLVTERGVSFGYNTLVVDFRSLPQMAQSAGVPVVFDGTHAVQQPGGQGTQSGGQREFIPHLARAAVAVGVDALFLETHPDPQNALSDAATMLPLSDMPVLLQTLQAIEKASGR